MARATSKECNSAVDGYSFGRTLFGMAISQQLRDAIEGSGLTRYAIAKGAGVDYYAIARFLDDGRDMRLSNIEKLTAFFKMRLTAPKTPIANQLEERR